MKESKAKQLNGNGSSSTPVHIEFTDGDAGAACIAGTFNDWRPEANPMIALGDAYSRNAEVTVPSLDDWERQWRENPQKIAKPAVVQVDFKAQQAGEVAEEAVGALAGGGQG